MPYISQEKATEILNEIKAKFPDFRFRKRVDNNSTLTIVITAGPIDLGRDYNDGRGKQYSYGTNIFWLQDHFKSNPEVCEFLCAVRDILQSRNSIVVHDGDYGAIPRYYSAITVENYTITQPKPQQTITQKSTSMQNATIRFNSEKSGIEISFSSKPAQSTIDNLKNDGFRWSKFAKVWWIKDGSAARTMAAKYGSLPSSAPAEPANDFIDLDAITEDNNAMALGLM